MELTSLLPPPDHELLWETLAPVPWIPLKIQSIRQRTSRELGWDITSLTPSRATAPIPGEGNSWEKLHGSATLLLRVVMESVLSQEPANQTVREMELPGPCPSWHFNFTQSKHYLFRRLWFLPSIATPSRVTIPTASAQNKVHCRGMDEGLAAWLTMAVHATRLQTRSQVLKPRDMDHPGPNF